MPIKLNSENDKRDSWSLTASRKVLQQLDKYIEDNKSPLVRMDRISVVEGLIKQHLTKEGYL